MASSESATESRSPASESEVEMKEKVEVEEKEKEEEVVVVEEEEEEEEEEQVIRGRTLALLTVGMMSVVFMMCLDHYILATAVPTITTDFNSLSDAAWYSSGYFLTNMALQPAFAQLYRLFPIKVVYLACVVLFEVGSILCAVAPSSAALIIGRLVTGIGGGGIYIGSVVLVGTSIPSRRRPMYISMVTSLDGVASAVGPLLGGIFTDSSLTWRFCFWINLPIGFIAFVFLWFSLSDLPRAGSSESMLRRLTKVDWLSMVLLLAGFSILLLALEWAGPVYPWSEPRVYGCIVGGGITLVLYFGYQYYQGDSAAIPYRVLRQRTVFASAGFQLLINMFIGALVYYLPFQFQAVRQDTAQSSGVVNLAFLMPLMLAPLLSGALISLSGWYVPLMYIGGILAVTGAGLITTFTASTSAAAIIGFQVLAGFGGGLCHQIPYTSILNILPARDVVAGSALCSLLNSLGAILGIVISQTVFTNLLLRNLGQVAGADAHRVIEAGPTRIASVVGPGAVDAVREAYGAALQSTFVLPVVAAGLCCICAMGMEWKRIKK